MPSFDWDRVNWEKCKKHGVSIAEIESLFLGTVLVSPDPGHSDKEERLKAFGTSATGRKMLVVFTLRDKGNERYIRPISARYMYPKEAAYYEKEAPGIEE